MVGNLGSAAIFAIIYLFTTLGIGLLVSASSHTQQQAMFMTWFITMFIFLMSGFIFSDRKYAQAAQWLSYLESHALLYCDYARTVHQRGWRYAISTIRAWRSVFSARSFLLFAVLRFQKRLS